MNPDVPVAIVGGGPCGLMTALLLARAGVRCTVFEKRPGISRHPKAMGISRRTAEIYRQLGLLEAMKIGSLPDQGSFLAIWSKSLVGEELGRIPFPWTSDKLSPCSALHCPQTWTEKVLLEAVEGEPLANIRFNCGERFVLLAGADCGSKPSSTTEVSVYRNGKEFSGEGFEELYGIAANGAVLVRPDGYVGARWRKLDQSFPEHFELAIASILRSYFQARGVPEGR